MSSRHQANHEWNVKTTILSIFIYPQRVTQFLAKYWLVSGSRVNEHDSIGYKIVHDLTNFIYIKYWFLSGTTYNIIIEDPT